MSCSELTEPKILVALVANNLHWQALEAAYKLSDSFNKEIRVFSGYHCGQCRTEAVHHAKALAYNFSHILFLDGDNIIPSHGLSQLYNTMQQLNADIVSGIYRMDVDTNRANFSLPIESQDQEPWSVTHQWCMDINSVRGGDSPIRVQSHGFGCALADVNTFHKMEFPWFMFTESDNEDTFFYTKARQLGLKGYIDPRVYAQHIRQIII